MRRREFLGASSGLVLTSLVGCRSAPTAQPQGISVEIEALEIMGLEADKGWDPTKFQDIAAPRAITGNGWQWWDHPVDIRPEIGWAKDEDSAEYNHLGDDAVGPEHAFALSQDSLAWLAERNHFAFEPEAKKIIFGLRGCTTQSGDADSGWVRTAALKTTRPNHEDMNCLLGVWDRERARVRVFQGSTVPQAAYLYKQLKQESGANMMPCGLYAYEVGTHAISSTKHRQIGALRLIGYWNPEQKKAYGPVIVLRTLNDLVFTPRDAFEIWDTCNPFDNIHSTTWSVTGRRADGPISPGNAQYSSAGCQVVRGTYEMTANRHFTPVPTDEWKEFREALGFSRLTKTSTDPLPEYGDIYHYMLLTGDEAALAETEAQRAASTYECIRFGSTGEAVKRVQAELGLEPDGVFGPGSTRKLIEAQIASQAPLQVPLRRLDVLAGAAPSAPDPETTAEETTTEEPAADEPVEAPTDADEALTDAAPEAAASEEVVPEADAPVDPEAGLEEVPTAQPAEPVTATEI